MNERRNREGTTRSLVPVRAGARVEW